MHYLQEVSTFAGRMAIPVFALIVFRMVIKTFSLLVDV